MSNEITTPYDRVLIDPNEPLILPDGTSITGRLETFLYALCCLDYDNLPTPLSRIEEFANALITGEIPNIEPQSRSEQFFLAILDGNIDNLPEPQSRSEVLLNKLAVGDFDLTNVDPIQSRYELLLAYLIKNGGVGNLDYVLYEFYQATQTLYNTQEKPVKGAILKGQTIKVYQDNLFDGIVESGGLSINNGENDDRFPSRGRSANFIKVEPNSTITFARNLGTDGFHVVGYNENKEFVKGFANVMKANVLVGKINTTSDIYYIKFYDIVPTSESEFGVFQGDVEPTYELLSVKMPVLKTTGKNLFDINNANIFIGYSGGDVCISNNNMRSLIFNVKEGCTYTIQKTNESNRFAIDCAIEEPKNATKVKRLFNVNTATEATVTIPIGYNYIVIYYVNSNVGDNLDIMPITQIEEGSTATPYEPYKSNILSTPSDLELRGIGEVQDTLDLMTGELTQRVSGLECIDQNSKLSQSGTSNDTTLVVTTSIKSTSTSGKRGLVSSHELIKYAQLDNWFSSLSIIFRLPKANENFATLTAFKQFLTQNPFYYYRELEKEEISIKTVDLSVIDQDGNVLPKIKTFNDTTHVNVSSDGILPKVEMEVATYNEEDIANANVMTASMDEIYSVQNELDNTNSIQSEEIDSTMIASTEIYENIL